MEINWKTSHSADGIITHTFSFNHIIAMADKNTGILYVQKDGQETQRIDVSLYSTTQYLNLMIELAEADFLLNNFHTNQSTIDAQSDCGNKKQKLHSTVDKPHILIDKINQQQTPLCNDDLQPESPESLAMRNKRILRWYEKIIFANQIPKFEV